MQKATIENYQPGMPVQCPSNALIVLVGGCFDILHYGHIETLERSRALGSYLVVALEPDDCILRKERIPAHTQTQRAENLAAIRYVDHVLMLPSLKGYEDYLNLAKAVSPHVIAVTDNDPQLDNKQKQADHVNGRLVVVNSRIPELSSSRISAL